MAAKAEKVFFQRVFFVVVFSAVLFPIILTKASFSQIEDTSMWLEKTSFGPGEEVRVHFTAPTTFHIDAWIGLIATDVPHDSEEVNERNCIERRHIGGMTSGVLLFTAPGKPGRYDFRMHDADTNGEEIGSMSFFVR